MSSIVDWKASFLVEQKELKEKFVKLVEFINSEEYYKLSENTKLLLKDQKIAMELYLNVLNMRVFEDVDNIMVPDYGMLQGAASIFCHTWSAPTRDMKYLEEQIKKLEEEGKKVMTESKEEGMEQKE